MKPIFPIAVCVGLMGAFQGANAVRSPNVILILADDQGYGDLRCHGHPCLKTPALDAFHSDSLRLKNFHVDPTCSPTRSALMTGKYASRVGVWHTLQGRSILREGETTMAEIFRDNGYRTGIFGKWHLGDAYPYRPQDRGFQETLIHGGGGIGQNPDYWGNTYFDDHYCRNGKWERSEGYCTDVWFREATRFIERNRDLPFFCYLALNAPHFWYRVPDEYARPYLALGMEEDRARFFGMIACIDANFGRLREKLRAWDLERNTILIYMSDNGHGGPSPTTASPFSFGAGMRGFKGSPYDGGHRDPCFIRWPAGRLLGGRDVNRLTAHFDLLPTLIEWCGLKQGPNPDFDGRSLAPLLQGGEAQWPDRVLCVHNPRMERPRKWFQCAVMSDRWRLVNGKQLYDMLADPGQAIDVAPAHPDVARQLRDAYEQWWNRISPRFDESSRVYIGAPEQNPVELTCHDWHSDGSLATWDPEVIRRRAQGNGWWTVQVARAGKYSFRIQDLPDEAAEDKRIDAANARLRIGAVDLRQDIAAGSTSVLFAAELPAGPARMDTWLMREDGQSRGAPFVYVEWKGE